MPLAGYMEHTVFLPLSLEYTFQDYQWMPETADSTEPNIYCFFPIHIPFYLKEALYGSVLAYSSCQHHYFYALGLSLSKISFT